MSITPQNPNRIHLAGEVTIVNDKLAGGAITPGMLVERYDYGSGVSRFRAHSSAGGSGQRAVALDQPELNRTVDNAYATGDLVDVAILPPGSTAWMLIPSGQNIATGTNLESAGNGKLRAYSSGVKLFQATESVNNSAGPSDARIRVEAL